MTTDISEEPISLHTPATSELSGRQRVGRLALAAAVALAIVATAWIVGDRQGWSDIGSGGTNAQLLPRVGEMAPELVTLREDGTPLVLSQLRGEPVWINFWGSWCAPCRTEMPEIQKAYETLAPEGLNVLSISMREDPAKAVAYRDQVGATFPVYVDPSRLSSFIDAEKNPELAAQMSEMHADWQVYNFPTHIFIDADGIVQRVVIAQMTYDEAVDYGQQVMGLEATREEQN